MKHLEIDVWDTADKFQQQGSSVYDMILVGTLKAREIAKTRNQLDAKEGRINKHSLKPINQALKEIENEINNLESE